MAEDAKKQERQKKVNPLKKAKKDEKKRVAIDGGVKVRASLQERRKKIEQTKANQERLNKALENAKGEDAKSIKEQLDVVMTEIDNEEKAIQEEQEEESKHKRAEEEAENEDIYDDMEGVEQGNSNPRPSIEGPEGDAELLQNLLEGLHLEEEPFDLHQDSQLRAKQAVLCYKKSFGTTAIVVDYEFPENHIYRIRNDISIPHSTPNLMRSRRAGKEKPGEGGAKWSVADMKQVLPRIAIAVPFGYEGNPEDLVRVIPKAEQGVKKPKQPDVQLLIEWKDAIMVDGKKRYTSLESRSGTRTLWKGQAAADLLLLKVATIREKAYRAAGGKNSSEQRSMSPFVLPRAGSQADREYTQTPEIEGEIKKEENEKEKKGDEESEKKKDEKSEKKEDEKREKKGDEKREKKEDEEETKKRDEEKEKKGDEEKKQEDDDDYEAKTKLLENYEIIWRMRNRVKKSDELTVTQEGRMLQSFEAYAVAQKKPAS